MNRRWFLGVWLATATLAVIATSGSAVGILDPSMRLVWERRPGTADFRNQSDTLRVSPDGATVEFSYDRFGNKISETSPRAGLTACP